MFHPQDNALSIIHHGRDRARLLESVYTKHRRECGNLLLPHEEFAISRVASRTLDTLGEDTFIRADSILQYLDLDQVDHPEFIFDYTQLVDAVDRVRALPSDLSTENKAWLLGRGVGHNQLSQFRDIRQVMSRQDRTVLGAEIHPALQRWVGTTTPEGVLWPWVQGHGTYVRLLSTVPKLKFGASVPLLHIATNLDKVGDNADGHDVWLVEGLFDALALEKSGLVYCTPSSGSWSALQLFSLFSLLKQHKIRRIVLAHDNDRVGLKENLFLWSVMNRHWTVEFFNYPDGTKDMSELVCRDKIHPLSMGTINPSLAAHRYLTMPVKGLVDYDVYLDNRQASYSNSSYQWNV